METTNEDVFTQNTTQFFVRKLTKLYETVRVTFYCDILRDILRDILL